MTQNRLDELMEKVASKEIDINDLAEICGAILQSNSKHSKDIKNRLSAVEKRLEDIEKNFTDGIFIIFESDVQFNKNFVELPKLINTLKNNYSIY